MVGPAAFNRGFDAPGANKADIHFEAFRRLLHDAWAFSADQVPTRIHSDKHGGRHYYFGRLVDAFPEARVERFVETPLLSRYAVSDSNHLLEVSFRPKADADDGLVALASMVSKTLRELWMDVFNDYWSRRIPGIKRTAGYPTDAARFRAQIEAEAARMGWEPSSGGGFVESRGITVGAESRHHVCIG